MKKHPEDILKATPVAIRRTDGVLLHLHVQPKSSVNAVAGIYDNAVKIKLTAPPADGAANRMCIKFLAKQLGVSSSAIEIISGHTGRRKQVFIRTTGTTPSDCVRQTDTLLKKIAAWTADFP
jgi:uncharacterized protein